MREKSPFAEFRCARSYRFSVLLAVLLTFTPSAAFAEAWKNARVVLKSGWEHLNITVERVPVESAVSMINEDGARKKVPYSDIRFIFDAQGNDITALVLAGAGSGGTGEQNGFPALRPSNPANAPIASPPGMEAQKKLKSSEGSQTHGESSPGSPIRMMIVGGAGFGTSRGDWFKGMTSGILVGGTMRVTITDKSYLAFSYGNQWLGVDGALKNYCEYRAFYCVSLDWDICMEEYYLMWGLMSDGANRRAPFLFVEAGLGCIRHIISITAFDGQYASSVQDIGAEFAGALNAGGIIPLGRRIGFAVEGTMRVTGSTEATRQYYASENLGGLFGAKIGLAAIF